MPERNSERLSDGWLKVLKQHNVNPNHYVYLVEPRTPIEREAELKRLKRLEQEGRAPPV